MPSTVIQSFTYNEQDKRLRIVFVTGKVYDYLKVPKEAFQEMGSAFSKGKYYNQHIKYNYDFEEVSNLEPSN